MPKFKHGAVVSSYFKLKNQMTGEDIYNQGRVFLEGQVIRTHFTDEKSNRSKRYVEYDVLVRTASGAASTIKNCKYIGDISGTNDFKETILEPNEVAFSGDLKEGNIPRNMNGTMIIVGFLDGSLDKPIIVGGFTHSKLQGATKKDGIRKKGEFRGIEWEINRDGEYTLTYKSPKSPDGKRKRESTGPTQLKIDKDGNFSINNNEDQVFELNRVDGKVNLSDSNNSLVMDKSAGTINVEAGSLIEFTVGGSKVTIDGSSGNITLEANGTEIIIDSSGQIDLSGSLVNIGEAVADFAVLGLQLATAFNTHTHTYITSLGVPTQTTPPSAPLALSAISQTIQVQD